MHAIAEVFDCVGELSQNTLRCLRVRLLNAASKSKDSGVCQITVANVATFKVAHELLETLIVEFILLISLATHGLLATD